MKTQKDILKLMTHVLEDINIHRIKPKKKQEPQIIDSDITSKIMCEELYPKLTKKTKPIKDIPAIKELRIMLYGGKKPNTDNLQNIKHFD